LLSEIAHQLSLVKIKNLAVLVLGQLSYNNHAPRSIPGDGQVSSHFRFSLKRITFSLFTEAHCEFFVRLTRPTQKRNSENSKN